jgi:signal transduction histidine kinase/ActR/RegA family two-component response regulator
MQLVRADSPIRDKLNRVVLVSIALGLFVAGLLLAGFDLRRQAAVVERDLQAQADIIGLASLGALTFDDRAGARENLSVLRANPEVAVAALYGASGTLLGTYVADAAEQVPAQAPPAASNVNWKWQEIARPVRHNDRAAGTIYVRARHNLGARALEHLAVLLAILALSLAVAAWLASRLQRTITEPLLSLAKVAEGIREGRFRMRAEHSARDEVGALIHAFNAMLDELERRSRVLESANKALKAGEAAKDQFLATLAHELRNPLAPIRTGQEILGATERLSPRGAQVLGTMQRQLAHLVRLIDDLMDLSRISNGKIRLDRHRLCLRAALDAAVEVVQPAIRKAGHDLSIDVDPALEVEGDLTRLSQAVGNLLHNAAKYTPAGGRLSLRCRREGAEAVIEVADNGLGIPPELLEQVFAMFSQVDRTLDRAQGGLGIGLSLVRSLVEMHGGRVLAASAGVGQGSTFTIRLPCLPARLEQAAVPAQSPDAGGEPQAAGRSRKILVVDDNLDAAETLASLLEMFGHEVARAHDGPSALATASRMEPDVILLDIGLPGTSGHDVARELRAVPRLRHAKLVAVTGWGSEADVERSRASGFDAHLTKPVEIDELVRLVDAPDRRERPVAA